MLLAPNLAAHAAHQRSVPPLVLPGPHERAKSPALPINRSGRLLRPFLSVRRFIHQPPQRLPRRLPTPDGGVGMCLGGRLHRIPALAPRPRSRVLILKPLSLHTERFLIVRGESGWLKELLRRAAPSVRTKWLSAQRCSCSNPFQLLSFWKFAS